LKVRQLCTRVEFGDAVSNHVLEIDRALSSWGHDTEVYTNTCDEYGSQVSQPDCEYPAGAEAPDDVLIYHYSVWCSNYEMYLASAARRILVYHNITPPQYFQAYDKGVASFCVICRELLPKLSGCDLALGDSEFNRLELLEAGFEESATGVLPILVDYEGLRGRRGAGGVMDANRKGFNLLFVGRMVPNKAIEDVLRAFFYYHRCVNSDSQLFLVGAPWVDRYSAQLQWLIDSFGLWGDVTVTGRLSDADLAACYRGCDAFLSMSEHDGFSVPLVESMAFDLPVVAYSSTAIPYTLRRAGLTFGRKDFAMVGELLESLRTDASLRDSVIEGQRARLEAFSPSSVRASLQQALERVTGESR